MNYLFSKIGTYPKMQTHHKSLSASGHIELHKIETWVLQKVKLLQNFAEDQTSLFTQDQVTF